MSELVSILIPVFNREHLIEETLKSALNQTYKNIEVIVVDNCSSDNTWKIIKTIALTDDRVKCFKNSENIGPVRNWARCINEAKGMYGKILWSDDLIEPTFLEETLCFFNDKDVGFVYTKTEIFIDKTEKKIEHFDIGNSGLYDSEQYIYGVLLSGSYPLSPGCALFRLKDLQKNLIIDVPNKVGSDFSMHAIGNDLLIYLLTAKEYKKFGYVNKVLSKFRAHNGSISIVSNDGKLPLHYALIKAYFIEMYRPKLISKFNIYIYAYLFMYRDGVKKYGLEKISNFYSYNKKYNIDIAFGLNKILKKLKCYF